MVPPNFTWDPVFNRGDFYLEFTMEERAKPVIREATLEDVYAIRRFHAHSWLETYPNESAGVPRSWVLERWLNWDSEEKLQESSQVIADILANKNHLYRIAVVGSDVVALMHAMRDSITQELGGLYIDKIGRAHV